MKPVTACAVMVAVLSTGTSALAQVAGSPVTATPPVAAIPPTFKAGDTIYDPSGGEAGTVDTVAGDTIVVSTGTHKVSLPTKAFGAGAKGPVISVTRAQLDAAAEKASADAAAALKLKLVPGAAVHGVGGSAVVGTIKSVEDQFVVVATPKGSARLPITAFGIGGGDAIIIGMTAAQFEAAVAAAK